MSLVLVGCALYGVYYNVYYNIILPIFLVLVLSVISRLWDIECGACLRILEGHEELVRCIRFDNKRIVSGAYDGYRHVFVPILCLFPSSPFSPPLYSISPPPCTLSHHLIFIRYPPSFPLSPRTLISPLIVFLTSHKNTTLYTYFVYI